MGSACTCSRNSVEGSLHERLALLLKKHQLLIDSNRDNDEEERRALLEFVDATYTRQLLLEDYIAFFSARSDDDALRSQLLALQCRCDDAATCGGMPRHFRDRKRGKEQGDAVAANLFLDLIDTLHFNVFHLRHVGLRVDADTQQEDNEEKKDDDDLVDPEMRRVAELIYRLRSEFAFERIDNTQNTKFTLKAQEELQGDRGGTFCASSDPCVHRSCVCMFR